jgi:primosomal protein N' (replication factor Y)
MAGSFSLKLLGLIQKTLEAGEQVLLIAPRRYYASGRKVEDELLEFCPKARIGLLDGTPEDRANTLQAFSQGELDILLGNTLTTRGFQSEKLSLVALVETDGLLSRQDFRADERAFQLLEQFRGCCRRMVVQTRDPHHPVFQILKEGGDPVERLLLERRVAGYPPFTRMIRILLKDSNEKRLEYLSKELSREIAPLGIPVEGPYSPSYAKEEPLREIRLLLPRDKALSARKAQIGPIVTAFEQARKYPGHIVLDVDPA